jgi:hypothetical protein
VVGVRVIGTLIVGLVFAQIGCDKITYNKVPSPIQWGAQWSAEKQAEADKMEGPRYYLPRPYVVLKTPVPIAARASFFSLTYDPATKQYKTAFPPDVEGWVKKLVPDALTIGQALAIKLADGAKTMQSATAGVADEAGKTAKDAEAAPPPTKVEGKVSSTNKEDPVTKLGEVFDVVYLPDFDEQYVIGRSYGIGKGNVQIELRNGWAAENFSENVDRSNLIPAIIDQVQNASKAALNVAAQWGLKSVGVPVGALSVLSQQSAVAGTRDEAAALDLLGNVVLLKLVEVRVAQPGLYPILKPREIRDWLGQPLIVNAASPDAAFSELLKQRGLAWVRPDQAFIPAPPFTMIGFNVVNDAYIGAVTKDNLGLGTYTTEAPAKTPSAQGRSQKSEDEIKKKLKATATAVPGIATKLKLDDIAVESSPAGNQTIVRIDASADLTGAELQASSYQQWITETFTRPADRAAPLNNAAIKVTPRRIEMTFDMPMSDLLALLKP